MEIVRSQGIQVGILGVEFLQIRKIVSLDNLLQMLQPTIIQNYHSTTKHCNLIPIKLTTAYLSSSKTVRFLDEGAEGTLNSAKAVSFFFWGVSAIDVEVLAGLSISHPGVSNWDGKFTVIQLKIEC